MKNKLFICLTLLFVLFASCKKENNSTSSNTNNYSIIESIAGAYSVQHNIPQTPFGYYANFNVEDLSISKDSLLFIDRISEERIRTYGFFNTTGTVIEDRIEFDSISIISSVNHPLAGTSTEVNVVASFDNAYYSNGVINLRLRIPLYRTEDNSLYENHIYKVIAIH